MNSILNNWISSYFPSSVIIVPIVKCDLVDNFLIFENLFDTINITSDTGNKIDSKINMILLGNYTFHHNKNIYTFTQLFLLCVKNIHIAGLGVYVFK
jgi:hypothetical protein